tara:strand:+ start:38561 stop:38932 length:372 start_codon:yes stop_codon:yes gene_type:complete
MNILENLKKIPKDKRNLNIYYHYPKDVFGITEITSEIVSFYEKDKDLKYQSIFFKYNSENIFKKEKPKQLTVNDFIEILENTINENMTDYRLFYINSVDWVYECSDNISYDDSGNEPCYVINN